MLQEECKDAILLNILSDFVFKAAWKKKKKYSLFKISASLFWEAKETAFG